MRSRAVLSAIRARDPPHPMRCKAASARVLRNRRQPGRLSRRNWRPPLPSAHGGLPRRSLRRRSQFP